MSILPGNPSLKFKNRESTQQCFPRTLFKSGKDTKEWQKTVPQKGTQIKQSPPSTLKKQAQIAISVLPECAKRVTFVRLTW